MNVVLIGYRATGKTTLARLLAERLGWAWIDADVEIERRAHKTIAKIFEAIGAAIVIIGGLILSRMGHGESEHASK